MVLLWSIRGCFVALMVAIAVLAAFLFVESNGLVAAVAMGVVLAAGGAALFGDLRTKDKDITIISAITFGLLFGLLAGGLFGLLIDPLVQMFGFDLEPTSKLQLSNLLRVMITVVGCYIGISMLLQTKDEFRFIIPFVEFSKQVKGGRPLVLDTSVIIDGRIADLCDTRIVDTKLVVPRFVLNELQAIADSSDKMKRNRGRRGLDILKRLQSNPKIELQMHDGNLGELKGVDKGRVDERLVHFTKAINGRVVTNDFNLNKIAQLQGVDVINLNEVANSLKTVALPGEYLQVKVVKIGDQPGQGIGYLDDGTMVVIEMGRNHIGMDVSLVVTSVLQTPAGRMIFGRIEARPSGAFSPVSGSHLPVNPNGSQPPTGPSSGATSVIKSGTTDPPKT